MEYIEYYKCKAKILDEKSFCEVLDLVNLYYNLKIINMIIRNLLGYETIWEEENGKKIKKSGKQKVSLELYGIKNVIKILKQE